MNASNKKTFKKPRLNKSNQSGSKTSKKLVKSNVNVENGYTEDINENIDDIFDVVSKPKKIVKFKNDEKIESSVKKSKSKITEENNDEILIKTPTKKIIKKVFNDGSNDVVPNKTSIKEPTKKMVKFKENETNDKIDEKSIKEPIKKLKKEIKTEEPVDINISNNKTDQSKKTIKAFLESKQFLKDHNIKISTITLDCKLHTIINLDKFAKHVVLKEDEIVSIKFGNRTDTATNRTIVFIKPKKKPSTKNFYNQVTILMKPTNNPTRNYINIKVFKNGSLQMTGCKDMDDFTNVTSTLINILKKGRTIKKKNGEPLHLKFIKDPEKISINDVKIRMINSNFKLDYKIDRKKLAKLLKTNHRKNTKDTEIGYVECKYEPTSGHSCVNIKYHYDETSRPSIFVFQTGAIIITGAKTLQHIIMAYHFINKILDHYHDKIRIIDLDQKEVQKELAKFFKNKNKNKNNDEKKTNNKILYEI
jgi:TATA-box binding protein (TBP) (component of TFIID and TFIIIB)